MGLQGLQDATLDKYDRVYGRLVSMALNGIAPESPFSLFRTVLTYEQQNAASALYERLRSQHYR